ncbi:MAG: hypothetical protein H7Z14_05305 [Anaerolineae bacterium]|nr:hypothetical protein [Phycisphaerae bacterium]
MGTKAFDGRIASAIARASMSAIAPTSDAARSILKQNETERYSLKQALRNDKAKPNPQTGVSSGRQLSARQLALARALVRGGSISAVAREQKVGRATIHRWQRLPEFQAELQRLHHLLATQPTVSSRIAHAPPTLASKRSASAADARFDRMLDDFLGRGVPRVKAPMAKVAMTSQ